MDDNLTHIVKALLDFEAVLYFQGTNEEKVWADTQAYQIINVFAQELEQERRRPFCLKNIHYYRNKKTLVEE